MKKLLFLSIGFIIGITALVSHAAPITPVTGGGTNTNTKPSIGSLLVGANTTTTANSQYGSLTVGANGSIPVASSTAPLGISWQPTSTLGISGGSGSVSTSSAPTTGNFPYWADTTGGLSGTSTVSYATSTGITTISSATNIGGNTNVTGTISQSGTPLPSGSGAANQLTYWSGTNAVTSDPNLTYSSTINQLSITSSSGNLAIGSSTRSGLFSAFNASGTKVFSIASTTNVTSSNPILDIQATSSIFQVLASGHINATGTVPTMGTCGTSPSVLGSDTDGTISVGGGVVTACTMNFQIPYETSNYQCVASDNSAAISTAITSQTTSTVTFGLSASLGGGKIFYSCKETL